MKDRRLYTLCFSAILGTVCAFLLTLGGRFTGARRAANARAEEVRNVLGVLGARVPDRASAQELVGAFEQMVEQSNVGGLTVFTYSETGSDQAVTAVPLSGPGLWGPIKGYLALEADMTTIRGITFHQQEETPGLGGEIGSSWFCDQFRGKRIKDASDRLGLRIRRGRGSARSENEVDGITGATMTCTKVEALLNEAIMRVAGGEGGNG